MKQIIRAAIAISTLSAAVAFADGQVSLAVELNPMGSFESTSTAVTGAAKKVGNQYIAQNVVLDLTTLDSGIELRDKHMKEEYFEVGKYPKAILIKAIGRDGKFAGILQMHNSKAKIVGTYKVSGKNIEAEFATPMSLYKIKKATYMGVGVEDSIKVKVKIPISG